MLPSLYAFDVDDTLDVSQDRAAANTAGWRFILETDFATGAR
jgi:hypothetical protein